MKSQLVNNCQGPHYIQLQKQGNLPPQLLILQPGLNLVDTKLLEAARKANKQFDSLFVQTIQVSRAQEADPRTFGKHKLEVIGKPLPDKGQLAEIGHDEAVAMINLTQNTDLLNEWRSECHPAKHSEILKAINARLKQVTASISTVSAPA